MQTNTVWTDNNERELNELKEKLGLPKYSDVLRHAVHFTLEKILEKKIDISIKTTPSQITPTQEKPR